MGMQDEPNNLPEFTVSEIAQSLKRTVEQAFERVRVRGEISRPTRAASGHVYLTLKDDNAVLDGICWRGQAQRLAVTPEEGLEVIVTGKLTTYPGRSKYQIIIDTMEIAGEGALLKLLEDRRRKLAAEGLFDDARKKALPFLPQVIGVVTSPTGAVIRDILHRLQDRFPVHVLVAPVLVQGDHAKTQIAAAIAGFNAMATDAAVPRPELLIVARGGGSLEDLWAFNEEEVVRATAASEIPIISAVGHETDTTLIDFASDRRAPTPTAAAEMAVPVRLDLIAQVNDDGNRLVNAVHRRLQDALTRLQGMARGLGDPAQMIEQKAQRLDYASGGIERAINRVFEQRRYQLGDLAARLISPLQRVKMDGTRLAAAGRSLEAVAGQVLQTADVRFQNSAGRLRIDSTARRCRDFAATLADRANRLEQAFDRRLQDHDRTLAQTARLLDSHSFERVLDKGFVLVSDAAGKPVLSADRAAAGDQVILQFRDGIRVAVMEGAGRRQAAASTATARPRRRRPVGDDQESLF